MTELWWHTFSGNRRLQVAAGRGLDVYVRRLEVHRPPAIHLHPVPLLLLVEAAHLEHRANK